MLNHVCLSALLLAGLLQQPPTEAGWTSLFNGKDIAGWKISKPGSFTIDNGAIVANGAASHAYYDGSFRNHNFKNFEVKVDVMTHPNSNGGVYVLIRVNDRQTVDWTQPADWNGGREGPGRAMTGDGGTIALQAHDPHSTVYFKNIRIEPLD